MMVNSGKLSGRRYAFLDWDETLEFVFDFCWKRMNVVLIMLVFVCGLVGGSGQEEESCPCWNVGYSKYNQ